MEQLGLEAARALIGALAVAATWAWARFVRARLLPTTREARTQQAFARVEDAYRTYLNELVALRNRIVGGDDVKTLGDYVARVEQARLGAERSIVLMRGVARHVLEQLHRLMDATSVDLARARTVPAALPDAEKKLAEAREVLHRTFGDAIDPSKQTAHDIAPTAQVTHWRVALAAAIEEATRNASPP